MKEKLRAAFGISKRFRSEINGVLEISWVNGHKILETKTANYSYGSLQRILKCGLKTIDLSGLSNVLLLGMGGGSVIKTLRDDFSYEKKITAIELDPAIIRVAADEFNILPGPDLKIIEADAIEYVHTDKGKYGLIIIDIFIGLTVPDMLFSYDFWKEIERLLKKNGYVIFNASVAPLSKIKEEMIRDFVSPSISLMRFDHVGGTNTLLTGKKG